MIFLSKTHRINMQHGSFVFSSICIILILANADHLPMRIKEKVNRGSTVTTVYLCDDKDYSSHTGWSLTDGLFHSTPMVLEEYRPSWLYPKERDSAGKVGSQKSLPLSRHSRRSFWKSWLLKGMALSLPPSPSSLSFLLASTWAMLDILTQAWSQVLVLKECGKECLLHGAAWQNLCCVVDGWRMDDGGERVWQVIVYLPAVRLPSGGWIDSIWHNWHTWSSAGTQV